MKPVRFFCACADYLSSLKSARESRQYGADVMVDYIYSEPRRIRKHVQGPAEGYHHREFTRQRVNHFHDSQHVSSSQATVCSMECFAPLVRVQLL